MMRRILVGAALAGAVFGLSTVSAHADSGTSALCTPKPVVTDCAPKPVVLTPKPVIAVPCATKIVTTATQCTTTCTTKCVTNSGATQSSSTQSTQSSQSSQSSSTHSTATSSTATSSISYVPMSGPLNTGNQIGSQWSAANDLVLLNDVANNSVKHIDVLNVGKLDKVNVGVLNNHQAAATSVLAPC
ncbi:hypothetical protein [Nonomuraea rhodomycinica]|uniref:Secreted protein n=1 Tax=Nonomuraea rhodomycinica TaxID=1712872 RepID=A0A7Y6IT83_9ACTN|nr:hypothetical protein [Nonomuraea rhodomycinica]NUW43765.1 hypothetical protein [Nonomuraea rhodomycinica]